MSGKALIAFEVPIMEGELTPEVIKFPVVRPPTLLVPGIGIFESTKSLYGWFDLAINWSIQVSKIMHFSTSLFERLDWSLLSFFSFLSKESSLAWRVLIRFIRLRTFPNILSELSNRRIVSTRVSAKSWNKFKSVFGLLTILTIQSINWLKNVGYFLLIISK